MNPTNTDPSSLTRLAYEFLRDSYGVPCWPLVVSSYFIRAEEIRGRTTIKMNSNNNDNIAKVVLATMGISSIGTATKHRKHGTYIVLIS